MGVRYRHLWFYTVHVFKARVKFEIIKCIVSCNKIIYSIVISIVIYFNQITPLTADLVHVFYTDITLLKIT